MSDPTELTAPEPRETTPIPAHDVNGATAQTEKPCWRRRWAMIRAVLAFCALIALYVTALGADDRVRETALLAAFGLAGAVALGYLGFATQDDRAWLNSWAQRRGDGAER